MNLEIVGHTADRIISVGNEIASPVIVKINRILAIAAGHKLGNPHSPSVGPTRDQRIQRSLSCKHQKMLQFRRKKPTTPWVFQGQRCEAIQYAKFAPIASVSTLYANNSNYDFWGHSIIMISTFQCDTVLFKKFHATVD